MVEIQKLSAEDRIVKYAIENLKMKRPVDNLESINVSREQIQQIEKILNNKYD
jgi:cell division protein FtsL